MSEEGPRHSPLGHSSACYSTSHQGFKTVGYDRFLSWQRRTKAVLWRHMSSMFTTVGGRHSGLDGLRLMGRLSLQT